MSCTLQGCSNSRRTAYYFKCTQRSVLQDRAYGCGCNSGSPLWDAVGSLTKRTLPPLEHYITWSRTVPKAHTNQLSKLIHLTVCKKTKHAVSRWYRTAYIPWLDSSCDTHKGKRRLNYNPQSHRGCGMVWDWRFSRAGPMLFYWPN